MRRCVDSSIEVIINTQQTPSQHSLIKYRNCGTTAGSVPYTGAACFLSIQITTAGSSGALGTEVWSSLCCFRIENFEISIPVIKAVKISHIYRK
jgi:hypothetical protein